MTSDLRNLVRARAGNRCEYCRIDQNDDPFFRFHIEHIVARQHGGATVESNLALACHHCNLHKGPNLTGIDPLTQLVTPLFNPRLDRWDEHFTRDGSAVRGLTVVGRATVRVLAMNALPRLQIRRA